MSISWLIIILVLVPLLCFALWLLFRLLSAGQGTDDAERKRIMKMVEAGKVSSEEATELLDAMGRSSALRGEEKFSRTDILTLVGVALVVLGFFLPWVHLDMRSMPGVFGQASAYLAGYHIGAIGWVVFIIGVLSAVPVFVTPKNFLYKISMLQIFLALVGLVLVISVLVRTGHLGAGLIFCLAGFIVALLASAAKARKLAA